METRRETVNSKFRCFSETIELDRVEQEYIDMHGELEVEGVSWEIEVSEILRRNSTFHELVSFMEDNSFPLKKEYNEMRKFTKLMDKAINSKPSSDDWFDAF